MPWYWDIEELLTAHAVGRVLESVDFMDAVTDKIIELLDAKENMEIELFVTAIVRDFSNGTAGRQVAVDVLVYDFPIDDEGYESLKSLNDPDFTKALAQEVLVAKGFNAPDELEIEDFSMILASGFLEKKWSNRDTKSMPAPPLIKNPCKYHHHT